ncbi:hypothetical protein SHJG_5927 [Streptomyces hygroscopicus subsp. jinggangensis 5008]|nr:hypothetical protein SHJG_5927 [Streptomyces hygroscopicus subsp. jinggangensis 5008]AGF65352.1 hypothetical protein SHJGH_5689 [Streptomyces hygroscopicus subsp. jinggangensis TL01]
MTRIQREHGQHHANLLRPHADGSLTIPDQQRTQYGDVHQIPVPTHKNRSQAPTSRPTGRPRNRGWAQSAAPDTGKRPRVRTDQLSVISGRLGTVPSYMSR